MGLSIPRAHLLLPSHSKGSPAQLLALFLSHLSRLFEPLYFNTSEPSASEPACELRPSDGPSHRLWVCTRKEKRRFAFYLVRADRRICNVQQSLYIAGKLSQAPPRILNDNLTASTP